jgi:thioredoxin reductase (NADPH)
LFLFLKYSGYNRAFRNRNNRCNQEEKMEEQSDIYDVVIVGGGPAGLTAALYTARAKLRTVIIDKSATAGALAYSSRIENYPGLTSPVTGKELLDTMRKQATGFGAEYAETQVVGIILSEPAREVITMDRTYKGKTVIIGTGSMGRKPAIQGESEFLGRGVSYCAICDAAFYKGKTVCIIGNSEEAIKEIEPLARFAETVYLVSPTPRLKVEDHPNLRNERLRLLSGYKVTAIEGTDIVERIRIIGPDRQESTIQLSGVFVYLHGNKPVTDFLGDAIRTEKDGCISVNSMMETSVPGVFAAGDVTCSEVRQVIVAASQGCLAALSAEKYITNRDMLKSDWGK